MANGQHAHLCDPSQGGCGALWVHGDENKGNVEAHTCPVCGKQTWKQVVAHSNARNMKPKNAQLQLARAAAGNGAVNINVIDFDDVVSRAMDALLLAALFVLAYNVASMIGEVIKEITEGEASK